MVRNIHIESLGIYLPKKKVFNSELDQKLGLSEGTLEKSSGVHCRYFADGITESNSFMAAEASREAFKKAQISLSDIDVIIYASGSKEQLLPCNAALVQRALGGENSGIPCFDVDSTCLSFVMALDLASYLLAAGRFHRALIVSSETATIALNWSHRESVSLIGDGAAALVVRRSESHETSKVLASHFETYSAGVEDCRIYGGGSRHNVRSPNFTGADDEKFLFEMNGRAAFKMASKVLLPFFEKFLKPAGVHLSEVDLFIPHQASQLAHNLIRSQLDFPLDKWVNILKDHGNMVAASIPVALYRSIESGRVKRGDKIILAGTSAGFSIGGILLEY